MTTNSTWWHCETSVGISPEAAESMVRNKISETLLPVGCCGDSARETTIAAGEASFGQLFPIFWDYNSLRSQCARVFQVVLVRNFLFALFISVIPALMPVVGLKVLHLNSSSLGLLLTSMGAGSVVGAVFIIPWLRARLSPDWLTRFANLLLVFVYVLMALVRETEVFFIVAALAGVGWTISASELWLAAQRAMPSWARGRMNATVILISQGAMALGGVIWGSAGATVGASYTLLGAAVLFFTTLFLARRLSINFAGNLEEGGRAPFLLVSIQKG